MLKIKILMNRIFVTKNERFNREKDSMQNIKQLKKKK